MSSSCPAFAGRDPNPRGYFGEVGASLLVRAAHPLCELLRHPSLLFLATLTVFLFRPPDLDFYHLDRIAFAVLVFTLLLHLFLVRERLPWVPSVSLPMCGLLLLSLYGSLTVPFDVQTWSLLAAQFLVPFTLFHLAITVFRDERSIRGFEIFCLAVLVYLTFVSLASLFRATYLIYPKYILDEALGIHADRARGPFLQAVANGITLNLLGLFAIDCWRRGRLRGPFAWLLVFVPLAILATMTRAVWLSFSMSIVALMFLTGSTRVRRACAGLVVAAAVGAVLALGMAGCRTALEDRLQERSPVDFRVAIYQVGWEMALEKPWFGWGQNQIPTEISKRMSDYRPDAYCAHNSYLEILVEHGFLGLILYGWMIVGLCRLSHAHNCNARPDSIDTDSRRLWLILIGVYLLNASFVVINYQFVNALFFTIAGILASRQMPASARRNVVAS